MSVFGITNYLLVTQKGRTYIPFVRGSGFLADFSSHAFYSKHVITAAHVSMPLRFPAVFGNPPMFQRIGERHLTPKILLFDGAGKRRAILPLEFKMHLLRGTSASALRIRGERELFERMRNDGVQVPVPFELDAPDSEIGEGEELIIGGMDLERDEEGADVAEMKPVAFAATARVAYSSKVFGPTVIAALKDGSKNKITAGMSGGPVIRKSTGKCVGVLVAGVKTHEGSLDDDLNGKPQSQQRGGFTPPQDDAGEDPFASDAPGEKKLKGSIFNEERLPRRINDEAAMSLALQEFEMAHKNMEPPCVDLVGQDETLAELGVTTTASPHRERFAAFIPLRELIGGLRYSENV